MPQKLTAWTPFAAPAHKSQNTKLTDLVKRVSDRARSIAESRHFTPEGQRLEFTKEAETALRDLKQIEESTRERSKRIRNARAKLAKAKEPPPASAIDRMEILELARVYREVPNMREAIQRRLLAENPTDMDRRLQVAFLATPPEIFGLPHTHYHDIITRRLQPDLGEKGDLLDQEEASVDADFDAVKALKFAILRVADRAELAEQGLATKPPHEFSEKERAEFIERQGRAALADAPSGMTENDLREYVIHKGYEAWRELLWDEERYGASLAHERQVHVSQATDVNKIFEEVEAQP